MLALALAAATATATVATVGDVSGVCGGCSGSVRLGLEAQETQLSLGAHSRERERVRSEQQEQEQEPCSQEPGPALTNKRDCLWAEGPVPCVPCALCRVQQSENRVPF